MTAPKLGHAARELLRLHALYTACPLTPDPTLRAGFMVADVEALAALPAILADPSAELPEEITRRRDQLEAVRAGDAHAREELASEILALYFEARAAELRLPMDFAKP